MAPRSLSFETTSAASALHPSPTPQGGRTGAGRGLHTITIAGPWTRRWVQARKWPDRLHYTYEARVLGKDAHGHWFGVPRGTLWRRPDMQEGLSRQVEVLLAPARGWWLAAWQGQPSMSDLCVHVTTPPVSPSHFGRCSDSQANGLISSDGIIVRSPRPFARGPRGGPPAPPGIQPRPS